jgi:hypothetical protein
MRAAMLFTTLLACSLTAACADLQPIELGVCGNHVLEDGELCDVPVDLRHRRRLPTRRQRQPRALALRRR